MCSNFLMGTIFPHPLVTLNEYEHDQLVKNHVVVKPSQFENLEGKHFHACILVDAEVLSIIQVIRDFNTYPKFMPHIKHITPHSFSSNNSCRFHLDLPLGIDYQYAISDTSYSSAELSWLSWTLSPWEENSIKDTWGQWVITPYKNTPYSLIQYQAYSDVGDVPFGFGWIIELITEKSLPDVLISTKKWIESHAKD